MRLLVVLARIFHYFEAVTSVLYCIRIVYMSPNDEGLGLYADVSLMQIQEESYALPSQTEC